MHGPEPIAALCDVVIIGVHSRRDIADLSALVHSSLIGPLGMLALGTLLFEILHRMKTDSINR